MPEAGTEKTLYIVFNGLISLVHRIQPDGSGDYIALMVKQDPHKYLAGSWLNEQAVPPGPLELSGVIGGDQALDPAQNLIIKMNTLDLSDPAIYAYIVLPKPVEVTSCYQVDVPDLLTDTTAFLGQSTRLSGVQVFKYLYAKSGDVKLRDSAGNVIWSCPNAPRDSNPSCAVLHFYNEPLLEGEPLERIVKHNLDEFSTTASLLGKQVGLTAAIKSAPANTTPPAGLLPLELESLGKRESVVYKITCIALGAPHAAHTIYNNPANCTGPDGEYHPDPDTMPAPRPGPIPYPRPRPAQ